MSEIHPDALTKELPAVSEPAAVPVEESSAPPASDVTLAVRTNVASQQKVSWPEVIGGIFVIVACGVVVFGAGAFFSKWYVGQDDAQKDDALRKNEIVCIHLVADPHARRKREFLMKAGPEGRLEAWIVLDDPAEAERLRCFMLTECWKKDLAQMRLGKVEEKRQEPIAAPAVVFQAPEPVFLPPAGDFDFLQPAPWGQKVQQADADAHLVERDEAGKVKIPDPWPKNERLGLAILRAIQRDQRKEKDGEKGKDALRDLLEEPADAVEILGPLPPRPLNQAPPIFGNKVRPRVFGPR